MLQTRTKGCDETVNYLMNSIFPPKAMKKLFFSWEKV